MKKNVLWTLLLALMVACSTVPLTGRQQINLIPASTMLNMSFQQYDQFLQQHNLGNDASQSRMVKRVGENIAQAVETYMRQNDMSSEIDNYAWEFNLIASDQVNAFCMPGGKVVVYEGILPVAKNETGLGVIMGHEIAHAIAEHGNERMSQMLVTQLGGMALSKALEEKTELTQQLWMSAYGVGTQLGVLLPYSRLHESEADRLGLIFMAMAGYDPRAAVDFWQRMVEKKDGASPPEFLSTHPSDATRIQKIKQALPEALGYYQSNK
jgi:predicted Zn-dependent protease